jgi:hypothetical protein
VNYRANGPPILPAEQTQEGNQWAGYVVHQRFRSMFVNFLDLKMIKYPMQWPLVKADQWMVLTNRFVHRMRTDADALALLAFMEWSMVPDEMYYGTIANALMPDQVSWEGKTFTKWERMAISPRLLTLKQADLLQQARADGKLFARKIDTESERSLVRYLDQMNSGISGTAAKAG